MNYTPQPILQLTREAYNALQSHAESQPELWWDSDTDFTAVLSELDITEPTEPTGLVSPQPIALVPADAGEPPNRADRQALDYYDNLSGITPVLASNDLLWAWITHFRIHEYIKPRWPLRGQRQLKDHIRAKWFVTNQGQSLWRDNAASRTWWIAHCAVKAAQGGGGLFTKEQALQHFAQHAEHYHNLMNYAFLRDETVLGEIVYSMLNDAAGINTDGIRQLLRALNRAAGSRYLGIGPRAALRTDLADRVDTLMRNPKLVQDRRRVRHRRVITVLSLGAGVQSTVMALMAERGLYGMTPPDFAIFADTGWEPPAVYEHLDWLKNQLSYEVITVRASNIRTDVLNGTNPAGQKFLDLPVFLTNPDGSHSIAARQCTAHYKLRPIHQYLRQRLELQPRRRAPKDLQVAMLLGISTDEAGRQKPSREEWITNEYPLIKQGWSRGQLEDWFHHEYPDRQLPRSACIGCPYKSNREWQYLQEQDPESFADAVFVDQALRETPASRDALRGEAFLHRARVPLSRVNFTAATSDRNLMLDECEGLCRT